MTTPATHALDDVVTAHKQGSVCGLPSICSAHPLVLEAAMKQAREDDTCVLIESTSNQVDQFGGYTGMTPSDFFAFVRRLAEQQGFSPNRVVLGGDHLGPNAWQQEPAAQAMAKARTLVADYASAGFTKLHLDTSMFCADDPGDRSAPLEARVVAERAAELCAVAEEALSGTATANLPRYVIGTEVPVPGGAVEHIRSVPATAAGDAKHTIEVTRQAFQERGLEAAWSRVIAVVVQPGVEFSDDSVVPYDRAKARDLSACIGSEARLVYEAHSTDYQTPAALRQMVEDHFAVLKVGPWLTFAMREALLALEKIEQAVLAQRTSVPLSKLGETLERVMVRHPDHWQKHYHGSPQDQQLARTYSYSDRARYYWPYDDVKEAVARLFANLERVPPPMTLLSQFLPHQYHLVQADRLNNRPRCLALDKIMEVTSAYAFAAGHRHSPWRLPEHTS